jgi:hypothetical protein
MHCCDLLLATQRTVLDLFTVVEMQASPWSVSTLQTAASSAVALSILIKDPAGCY